MAKLIKGYYKDGVWHEYGGKLYNTIGYNTNGSMTQKAITDTLGSVMEVVSGYSMVVRVHGDASCSNLAPFYFVVDGDAFTMTITYNQPAIALNLSIIMGNTDITHDAYQDGVISIPRVTGNVVITVETASVTNTNMFTKRTTADGATVLNNKALLKGVRGFTAEFWQKLDKPEFSDGSSTGWTALRGTIRVSDGIMHVTRPSSSTISIYTSTNPPLTQAHKYLFIAKIKQTEGTANSVKFSDWAVNINVSTVEMSNGWKVIYATKTYSTAPASNYRRFCIVGTVIGVSFDVEWAQCIDLTYLGINNYNDFIKSFPNVPYPYNSTRFLLNNVMTNYVSKDAEETTLQNVSLNVPTLTGKLNGEGESVVIFPNGMKSSCNEAVNDTYDEIKQVDGVWKAIKRIGTERATSAISGRGEYEILAQEEVYILDDQTIPTEITVADQGTEEILPTNGATPTTAPAIMEIQYGAIPSRGLLGGLLGGTKGGGSNEPDYSDGEEITNYEEEQEPNEDSDEPIVEEPLEEPLGEESKEDENEEEPKEDIKESPVVDEKKELKK